MYIGNIIDKIDKKYHYQKFNRINFNSKKCKKGDIFLQLKVINQTGISLFKMRLKMVQKSLYLTSKHRGIKKVYFILKVKILENYYRKPVPKFIN